MVIFWSIIINFCVVLWGPCIALVTFVQNCTKKVCSAKESRNANILSKALGGLVLFGLFVYAPDTFKESWQGLLDIPTIMISEHCFGIIVFALLVILLSFYIMIFGDNVGVEIFYKYERGRMIAIGIQLVDSAIMIVYLFLINVNGNINKYYWKYILLFDLMMFAVIVVLGAIKVAYTKDGVCFEYNTVISQRKLFVIGDNKFDVVIENEDYIVKNGEEEVRMKKLTPRQIEGLEEFIELTRGKQNGK